MKKLILLFLLLFSPLTVKAENIPTQAPTNGVYDPNRYLTDETYYLNSFATDWEIYKRYLKVVFNVRNAQELVMTLKKCVEQFNV